MKEKLQGLAAVFGVVVLVVSIMMSVGELAPAKPVEKKGSIEQVLDVELRPVLLELCRLAVETNVITGQGPEFKFVLICPPKRTA